ncbi:MAG: hypothetical protein GXP45_04745 [bacterium]|nr:hypothetical protein [bacterium]
MQLDFSNSVPRIEIYDHSYDMVLFWITLPVEKLLDLKMYQGSSLYKKVALK